MQNPVQLNTIIEKVQLLIKNQENTVRDNQKLKQEAEELRQKLEIQSRKINSLEQTIAVLKTLSGKMEEADKKELDKRLNQYLKEIDRCITMLSD